MTLCPCGSAKTFKDCCAPYLAGEAAPTAEALMRSRFTAYAQDNYKYLSETLTPEERDDYDPIEAQKNDTGAVWQGLEIRALTGGGKDDETGTVEFVASYRIGGQHHVHHERSNFRKIEGRWYCGDGEVNPKTGPVKSSKVGRNDPCPCGSGKKYKKCCSA